MSPRTAAQDASAAAFSGFIYTVLVFATTACVGLSCAAILSQAVRNSPERSWESNWNAVVIGASYAIVVSWEFFSIPKRAIRL